MVSVPSTLVSVGLTIAGDLASFGTTQQDNLKASLRKELLCEEPTCFLSIVLSAGSINVQTRLAIPQSTIGTAVAGTSSTVASIQAAAATLVTSPPSTISSALGVSVNAANPTVRVQAIVAVPLAVAPPPPLPPSPMEPFVMPLAPGTSTSGGSGQTLVNDTLAAQAAAAATNAGGFPLGMVVGLAVGGGLVLVALLFTALYLRRVRRRPASLSSTTISKVSAVDVSSVPSTEKVPSYNAEYV